MSHVFSTLDEAMGPLARPKSYLQPGLKEELHGKDSWVDQERAFVTRRTGTQLGATSGGQAGVIEETGTARSMASDPDFEWQPKSKSKAVNFEEPSNAEHKISKGQGSYEGDADGIEGRQIVSIPS